MKAHTLPAREGWNWLTSAFALYARNPGFLIFASFAYWLQIIMLNLIPLIGPVLASIAMPAISVGIMNACRDLDQGRPPLPQTIFSGFSENRTILFALGALYLGFSLGIVYLSSLLDGGRMLQFLLTAKLPDKAAADDLLVRLTPFIICLLFLPVFMAYWYAPILAAWHRLSLAKALFFSLVACWRNWRPFLVYGLALATLFFILPAAALTLIAILMPSASNMTATLLGIPLLMLAMPVVFASFYISYRDVFSTGEAP